MPARRRNFGWWTTRPQSCASSSQRWRQIAYETATAGTSAEADEAQSPPSPRHRAARSRPARRRRQGRHSGEPRTVGRADHRFVGARRETEKIEALDLGADDYINKPFNVGELLARMRTALRHRLQRKAEIPVCVSAISKWMPFATGRRARAPRSNSHRRNSSYCHFSLARRPRGHPQTDSHGGLGAGAHRRHAILRATVGSPAEVSKNMLTIRGIILLESEPGIGYRVARELSQVWAAPCSFDGAQRAGTTGPSMCCSHPRRWQGCDPLQARRNVPIGREPKTRYRSRSSAMRR